MRLLVFVWLVFVSWSANAAVHVQSTDLILRGDWRISAGQCTEKQFSMVAGENLTGYFTVSGDFDNQLVVELLDLPNYQLLRSGRQYRVYSAASGLVRGIPLLRFRAPQTSIYYLRFCNSQALLLDRFVSARIYKLLKTPNQYNTAWQQWLQLQYDTYNKLFNIPEFNASIRLCGEENAFSDPNIVLCQELLDSFDPVAAQKLAEFIFAHEMGHSALHLWGLPMASNEDAADEFATSMMLLVGNKAAALQAAQWWAAKPNLREEALAKVFIDDRHSLSPQRARNIIRWIGRPDDLIPRWLTLFAPRFTDDFLNHMQEKPEVAAFPAIADELRRRNLAQDSETPKASKARESAKVAQVSVGSETPQSLTSQQSVRQEPIGKSLMTRFGNLEIKKLAGVADNEVADTIFLDGEILTREPMMYVLIDKHFRAANHDIVIVTVSGGGSGSFDEYRVIILWPGRRPTIINNTEFRSADGTMEYTQSGDSIHVNLGFDGGLAKTAEIEGDSIRILRSQPAKNASISPDSCASAYQALTECTEAKKCTNAADSLSKYSSGNVDALSNHPAFNRSEFNRQCTSTCQTKNIESLDNFSRSVCGR